jgi:hypothetical protein
MEEFIAEELGLIFHVSQTNMNLLNTEGKVKKFE